MFCRPKSSFLLLVVSGLALAAAVLPVEGSSDHSAAAAPASPTWSFASGKGRLLRKDHREEGASPIGQTPRLSFHVARGFGAGAVLDATYLGGSHADTIEAIAVDPSTGDVIVAGETYSPDFPGTSGGARSGNLGGVDVFVARFDSSLSTLLHATYLGGSGGDVPLALAVHPSTGDIYIAGLTDSTDFPGTYGKAQPKKSGTLDGFVVRLDPTLTRIAATYLGGANVDRVTAIGIHPMTREVVVGGYTESTDLPGTSGGAQPASAGYVEGFLARLDPGLTRVLQATYLGGSGPDFVRAVAIHPASGEILAAGQTYPTPEFPATEGGANASPPGGNGNVDAFVTRLDPTLTRFLQSTYLGSAGAEDIYGVAVHPVTGEIYVAGWTDYSDFPATAGGAQPAQSFEHDGFVARFNASLTALLQASYLGGSGDDFCYGIAISPGRGDVYVVGETLSTDLPGGAGATAGDGDEGFVTRLDPTLTRLLETSYLGGSDDDFATSLAVSPPSGDILVAGGSFSSDLPGAGEGAQPAYEGGSLFGGDGFVSRLSAPLGGSRHSCEPGMDTLCLDGGRFKVRVAWRAVRQGTSGDGIAVPLTNDTGYFWFFNSANVELVVKILDARTIDERFWLFYGALSDVEYEITVTDTDTGRLRTYINPSGRLASFADTAAFDEVPAGGAVGKAASGAPPAPASDAVTASEATLPAVAAPGAHGAMDVSEAVPCAPESTVLCLGAGRFRVEVAWSVPDRGSSGRGMAVPLTSDTGYFWFFGRSNVELVLKILDARTVNGKFWVFYGALSNVEYRITVTDTESGAVRTYTNPNGTLASVADTAAF
jgi:hypothetical protein